MRSKSKLFLDPKKRDPPRFLTRNIGRIGVPDPRRTVYELSKTFAHDRNESDVHAEPSLEELSVVHLPCP